MSNDKHEATYHGGYRADWSGPNDHRHQMTEGHPGPEPWAPHDYNGRRNRGPWLWVILVLVLGLVLTLASVLVERSGVVPAGVPVIGQDKGLAVCEALASNKNPTGDEKGKGLTLSQIREVRGFFSDSRYPEIREPGVKMMDLAAQMADTSDDELGGPALGFLSSFTETYAALSGGCARHGYEIPAVGA